MRYGSVCSGIEAATAAWHPLGWEPAFYSEIEAFPRAVLEHHYQDVPLHGDFTTIGKNDYGSIELLVGGTPCQSFSIAGLRKGLDDERGNLALEYLRLAQRTRPTWLVWENVPGVLSSSGGRDFGAFLGGLVELGYGFAYRVLDAQFFGVAQRRRRVFVVGYLGDWRRAAAVLFECHSLQGHPPPSRETGEGAPCNTQAGPRGRDKWPKEVASTLDTTMQKYMGYDNQHVNAGCPLFVPGVKTQYGNEMAGSQTARHDSSPCADRGQNVLAIRTANTGANGHGVADECAHTLDQAQGQAIAFTQNQRDEVREMEYSGALAAEPGAKQQTYIAQGVSIRGRDGGATAELSGEVSTALRASQGGGDKSHVMTSMAVRRLTPRECERLQGFTDDYTLISWRGKDPEDCPDGPRYKALGNSMAVPVMAWIGKRIEMVDTL